MAIARVFFDSDMRFGITGLTEAAKKQGVKAETLKETDFLLFMNKKKTSLKIIWGQRYLLNLRKPLDEGKITMEEIMNIPNYFKGKFIAGSAEMVLRKGLGVTQVMKSA